jgi:hypothetical protein
MRRTILLALSAGLVLAACSSSGSAEPKVATSDLAGARSCPVALDQAAKRAGRTGHAPTGSVKSATPDSAVGMIDGLAADCGLTLSGGTRLTLTLVTSGTDAPAANLLVPALQQAAGVSSSDVPALAAAIDKTSAGHLVALPASVRAGAALAVVRVEGAKSAAFLLRGAPLSRAAVEKIAHELVADF